LFTDVVTDHKQLTRWPLRIIVVDCSFTRWQHWDHHLAHWCLYWLLFNATGLGGVCYIQFCCSLRYIW